MTKIINNYSSVKNVILLFGLVLFFNFIIFPISHQENTELAILDLQISYSPNEAYEILEKYSKTEREHYLVGEITVDLIYPVIYTFMLCFSIFLLTNKMGLAKLPILVFIFDYAENFGIVIMLYNYPTKLENIARATSIMTTLKWFFVFISVIIILYGLWIRISSLLSINNRKTEVLAITKNIVHLTDSTKNVDDSNKLT